MPDYRVARLRGRGSVDRRQRPSIAWVWDVYDADQHRALAPERRRERRPAGRDAWAAADDQVLRRIARSRHGPARRVPGDSAGRRAGGRRALRREPLAPAGSTTGRPEASASSAFSAASRPARDAPRRPSGQRPRHRCPLPRGRPRPLPRGGGIANAADMPPTTQRARRQVRRGRYATARTAKSSGQAPRLRPVVLPGLAAALLSRRRGRAEPADLAGGSDGGQERSDQARRRQLQSRARRSDRRLSRDCR